MFVDIARQVIVENMKFETHTVIVFSLSKKDTATRHALKTIVKNLAKQVATEWIPAI